MEMKERIEQLYKNIISELEITKKNLLNDAVFESEIPKKPVAGETIKNAPEENSDAIAIKIVVKKYRVPLEDLFRETQKKFIELQKEDKEILKKFHFLQEKYYDVRTYMGKEFYTK